MRMKRWIASLMALAVSAGLLLAGGSAAHAGSKGRKNTMIGLGAVAAYSLLKGKTTQGLIAGAGTAYAYKRYRDARKDEKRRQRYYSTRYNRYPRSSRYSRSYR
jgi:uncharacterized membrane protein YebE (DUF533 family)